MPPEPHEPPLHQQSNVELRRRYTALGLARYYCGPLAEEVRGVKDVEAKKLTVKIKWRVNSTPQQRTLAARNLEGLLQKWAWDGWSVSVVSAWETSRRR